VSTSAQRLHHGGVRVWACGRTKAQFDKTLAANRCATEPRPSREPRVHLFVARVAYVWQLRAILRVFTRHVIH